MRLPLPLLVIVAALGTGCADILSSDRPPPTSIAVSLGIRPQVSGGGVLEAYTTANRLRARLYTVRDETLEVLRPFDGSAAVTRIPLAVELEGEEDVAVEIFIELLLDEAPLFQGGIEFNITPGRIVEAEIDLDPIATAVVIDPADGLMETLGGTLQLAAFGVFATGDRFPDLPVSWASSNTQIAQVNQQGVVTAVSRGDVQIFATYGNLFAEATILVRPIS